MSLELDGYGFGDGFDGIGGDFDGFGGIGGDFGGGSEFIFSYLPEEAA